MEIDLNKNKYSEVVLKQNIYKLNLFDILKTQRLSARFVVRYILNNCYKLTKEEEQINVEVVLMHQPHVKHYEIANEQFIYDSCDSEIEDEINFEKYAQEN
uniref:Uncharacterized protein n=1 Tax=viral metagenome TaxID=1070528 RepID=A0A6C0LK80_9ZZZZ